MKLLKILGLGVILGLFAVSASAESINGGTPVGSIDAVLGTETTNLKDFECSDPDVKGGTALEECWAESITKTDLDYNDVKTEEVAVDICDSGDCFAFALKSGPGYYIVKNSTTRLIVRNLEDIDWGVIAIAYRDILGLGNLEISHVTEFDGGGDQVPEPGTLGLLGLGLLSLGVVRHRVRMS
jgi:hypothetical protein